jgi:hypothetical protein
MLGYFASGDCPSARHTLEAIVIPLIAKLRRSTFLASKLVFPVFPLGHGSEGFVIDFSKVIEMDNHFNGFVTKCVAALFYFPMSFDESFSTFILRDRCWKLWSGVLNVPSSSDEVQSIDRVPLLVPVPVLVEPEKLTVPFVLADIKHPKIPMAMGPRKAWTDSQRSAILGNKPFTVRWKSDFDKRVSPF